MISAFIKTQDIFCLKVSRSCICFLITKNFFWGIVGTIEIKRIANWIFASVFGLAYFV